MRSSSYDGIETVRPNEEIKETESYDTELAAVTEKAEEEDMCVTCDFGVTIETSSPIHEFKKVDLPTFGLPIIETKPALCFFDI